MSDMKKPRFSSTNAPLAQGGRSPIGATGAIRVDKGCWSRGRKRDVVLRILRGETLDALGRELTASPAKLAQWRDDSLAGGQCRIQVRDPDQRDDFIQDLKTKIGDQMMMHRIAQEEIQPAGRRPAFSIAKAIAMSATMSPSALKPFGIKRVFTLWNISRASIQRHKVLALRGATPKKKRGPKTCLADAQVLKEIKIVLRNSPFVGEGYRKVDVRLRAEMRVFSAPRRILRIMRENNLRAPMRCRSSPGLRVHDGTIVTERPDEMWAIDCTLCITDQGNATVFVVEAA